MKIRSLAIKNMTRKPGRTAALVILTAFLAFSVFGGSIVVSSLRRGLHSLESRLGADIIVLPSSAQSKVSFEKMLLQGTTGAFYMDRSVLDEVRAAEGVESASPQTFLASLKADCCSVKIQVIGMDPETDFIVWPWIQRNTSVTPGDMEVAVGCRVTAQVGENLRIYDKACPVIASLAPTGTGLDTAVYCNMETMNTLLKAAEEKGVSHKISSDEDNVISAVYVKVKEGYDVDSVNSWLNGHIRKTTAVRTKNMLTGVSDSLSGIAGTVTLLIAAVWILALVVLLIVFGMMILGRRREFAVLRLIGTSRRELRKLILTESALASLGGAVTGIVAASVAVFPFTILIESRLQLPYLVPSTGSVALLAAATAAGTLAAGIAVSVFAAWRLSLAEPGTVLREGV